MMSDLMQGLLVMTIAGPFVGTTGSGLAILWSRAVTGEWPDRDKMIFAAKLFYGIGVLGIVTFLIFKYA